MIDVTTIGIDQRDEYAARVMKHLGEYSAATSIVVAFAADLGDYADGWEGGGVVGAVWELAETAAGIGAGAAAAIGGCKAGSRWGAKGCAAGAFVSGFAASVATEWITDELFSQSWDQ